MKRSTIEWTMGLLFWVLVALIWVMGVYTSITSIIITLVGGLAVATLITGLVTKFLLTFEKNTEYSA